MTPKRRQRLLAVVLVLTGAALAVAFTLRAFQENMLYFYSPSQVAAGEAPAQRAFRVGGLVTAGSVRREPGKLDVQFTVTDMEESIDIQFAGILPDLFREGQGIIAHGTLRPDGVFTADEVLAKHDENYMPPEVAESLKNMHQNPANGGGSR